MRRSHILDWRVEGQALVRSKKHRIYGRAARHADRALDEDALHCMIPLHSFTILMIPFWIEYNLHVAL